MNCAICNELLGVGKETVSLREKGCIGINKAANDRGDTLCVAPGQVVHKHCRASYTSSTNVAANRKCIVRKRSLSTILEENERTLRSQNSFNFSSDCLFCSQAVESQNKVAKCKSEKLTYPVRTDDFKESILTACLSRKDAWSDEVYGRIQMVNDLHAADAVYHQACSVAFRTNKSRPSRNADAYETPPNPNKRGRPSSTVTDEAFLATVKYLEENDDAQVTVHDLIQKMSEYLSEYDIAPYSFKYMKKRLQDHFQDTILITEVDGKSNIVTFKRTAAS